MTLNAFRALQELLPQPRVVVGMVTAIHADDTSTVQLPGPAGLAEYAAGVFTGTLIRARGATVPVGSRAFVRDWPTGYVVETQAPDGAPVDMPVGTVTLPPPPPPPAPAPPPAQTGVANRLLYRGTTASLQYLTQYQARNPAVTGMGGGFAPAAGWTVSADTLTATVNAGSTGSRIFSMVDVFTLSPGTYGSEIVVSDIKPATPPLEQLGSFARNDSALGLYLIANYSRLYPGFFTNRAEVVNRRPVEPTVGSTAALVVGDVVGVVFKLTDRNVQQGCTVDVYKNGVLEVHGCPLPKGEDPTLWTLARIGAYW